MGEARAYARRARPLLRQTLLLLLLFGGETIQSIARRTKKRGGDTDAIICVLDGSATRAQKTSSFAMRK